jgi:hypothetical protein
MTKITLKSNLMDLATLVISKGNCENIICLECPLRFANKTCETNGAYKWAKEYIEEQKKLKYLEELT